MTDAPELLPCPFCGSSRVTIWNIRDGAQAVCKDCSSLGAPVYHGPEGFAETPKKAREAWNARAALAHPEVRELVDFVEDLLSGRDRDDDWRVAARAALARLRPEGGE